MQRFRRFTPIAALIAFLLSSGLGAGALLNFCTRADGTAGIETPFSRCCDEEIECADELTPTTSESRLVVAPTSFGCTSCVDMPLGFGRDHRATVQQAKDGTSRRPDVCLPIYCAPPLVAAGGTALGAVACSLSDCTTALAAMQTVVLRC